MATTRFTLFATSPTAGRWRSSWAQDSSAVFLISVVSFVHGFGQVSFSPVSYKASEF